jgi:V8-like Glu-specific endopeptidase
MSRLPPRFVGEPLRTAFLLSPLLLSAACSGGSFSQGEPSSVSPTPIDDPVLNGLSKAGSWERVANPVHTTKAAAQDQAFDPSEAQLAANAQAASQDRTWYAADGARYEALFVLDDGTAYGRRGPAPGAPSPTAANAYGASHAIDEATPPAGAAPTLEGVATAPSPDAVIAVDSSGDRRPRVSDIATLTSYPTRTSGAMSGNGDTQGGGCTGTKVGPIAILSAAHCVMDAAGNISFTGQFNPGQTNTTATNGSIARSGVFLRDYRIDRRFDYSVAFLQDSQAVVSLGWMGVMWWDTAAGYTGRLSKNLGYPCGPNNGCGAVTNQTCKASPRSDRRCDGWMYGGDDRTLDSNAFQSNDLLQYDNDVSQGHSGSAIFTIVSGFPNVMAVVTNGQVGQKAFGPRFRQSMWNDVCSWIGNPSFQSAFGTHPLCHP